MDIIESNFEIEVRHPWETARLKVVLDLIRKNAASSQLKILDIGSGDAFVAASIAKAIPKSSVHCVDIAYTSQYQEEILKTFDSSNINLHKSLDEVEVNKTFDLVTLLDVIEHVPDDEELLKSILNKNSISDDTLFLVTVPAFQSLFSLHDKALKHYRRYSLDKLRHTMAGVDLEIKSDGYFFSSLVPPRILQVLKEKIQTGKHKEEDLSNLGNWTGGKSITSFIEKILYTDYTFGKSIKSMTGMNIPGLSCYAIAKKGNN